MPPQGARRPDPATSAGLLRWLETELDAAAAARPNPGPSPLRRLNRAEYANAIRDLLAARCRCRHAAAARRFGLRLRQRRRPLGVSPALLERYLSAAGAHQRAGGRQPGDPSGRHDLPDRARPHADAAHRRPAARHPRRPAHPPHLSARRRIRDQAETVAQQSRASIRGLCIPISSKSRSTASASTWSRSAAPRRLPRAGRAAARDRRRRSWTRMQVRVPVQGGAARDRRRLRREDRGRAARRCCSPSTRRIDPFDSDGVPQRDAVTITGPFNRTGPGDTPSRRRIFVCRPAGLSGRGALCAARFWRRSPAAPSAGR